MAEQGRKNVFVSYVHENKKIVSQLVATLKSFGIGISWDEDYRAGDVWQTESRKAISTGIGSLRASRGNTISDLVRI